MKHPVKQNHPRERYDMAVAIAIVLTSTLLRLVFLQNMEMRHAFITFYPAVTLAALYGGLRAGAVATILSGLIADYFWMEPAGSFIMANPIDWLSLAIFVSTGFLVSWGAEKFYQANNRLQQDEAAQRVELERLVAGRTAALTEELALRKQAEDTLRKNSALTRLAADTARMTYAEFDFKTERLQLAENFARVMGYTLPPLSDKTNIAKTRADMLSHIAPEYRAQVQAANREFVTGKRDGSITYRVIGDDGAERWIEGRWIAEADENGCPVRGIAASLDITERKQAEAALRDSEERFRLLVEQAVDGIFLSDAAGHYIEVNSAGCKMLGYTRDEILSRTIADVIAPEEMSRIASEVGKFAAGQVARSEWHFRRKDGSEFKGEVVGRQLPDGRLLGILRDITERKQAEEALRKSEQRLKRVFKSRLLGLVYWNMNGDIVDANDKFLEMVGYERADLTAGRIDWKQMTPPEFVHLGSYAELKVTAANSVPFEKEYIRKDGSRVPVLAARAMFDEVHGDGVAFVIDISERKQAEQALALAKAEAERANVAKSKFLAAASHDLRQPVQSLTLLLSAVEGQVKDKPRAASAVEMAKSAVDSLNGLLTGILDISKLEAGVVTPILGDVNLGELVDRVAKEYGPRAAAEGLTLRHVSSDLWARTDAALVERIARNLIENALRYTEKGGILIALRRRGGNVRLDVIDTGIGIPADKQAEIFEEFRQLNNPARDASRGLGLGLAIVSRLAQLLGAPVQVASRVGHGTRFSLLLPLIRAATADTPPQSVIDHPGARILIIEDNTSVLQAYEIMLNDWGYETLCAAEAEQALNLAAKENWHFDAILADHRLGSGLTGTDAAAEIGRRVGRAFPTLVITGDTAAERLTEVHTSGFAILHKPVDADELRRALASLLRGGGAMPPITSCDST